MHFLLGRGWERKRLVSFEHLLVFPTFTTAIEHADVQNRDIEVSMKSRYLNDTFREGTLIELWAKRDDKGIWDRTIVYGNKTERTKPQGSWEYDKPNATQDIRFHCMGPEWKPTPL